MKKKMWYIDSLEYYSALRKQGILPIELEDIILSEIGQQQNNYFMTTLTWEIYNRLNKTTKSVECWVPRSGEVASGEVLLNGYGGLVLQVLQGPKDLLYSINMHS